MYVSMTHERSSIRQRGKNISLDTKGSTDKFSDSQDTPKREGYAGKYGELYIYMNDFKFISSILKGTVCDKVGKGGLTIWIGFGKKIKINEKEKHTYYLVIQTPWRFLQDKKIILASGDMYIPMDSTKPFDVGNDDNSLYDERVKELNTKLSHGIKVVEATFSAIGDITLSLENHLLFQTFIDESTKNEFWRFISNEQEESRHVVFWDV